ncbi:MAG: helix-turn-helix domain-containing protein [Candidatus Methanoplasma sp.]|jgi:transcriptional regulator with XRE-family HTH domain|nr:helix-turn-helix domain-containing protein [Candidatus Methanoplasma sp.]
MYIPSDAYELSDADIVRMMGEKLKTIRLNNNITRDQLRQASGVHVKTIGDLESGKNVTLSTLIAVLRGLRRLNLLDCLLEDEGISPILAYKMQGRAPKRATGRSSDAQNRRMRL